MMTSEMPPELMLRGFYNASAEVIIDRHLFLSYAIFVGA